jgi:1,4-alpha-glucan branching enzyme
MRFVYENGAAKNVRIVGDFNNWSRRGMSMKRVLGTDYWTVEIPLEEGIYKYVFLVDNSEWTPDPLSEIKTHDNFGNESSLILLLDNPEGGLNL